MSDSEHDPSLGTCEKLAQKIAKIMEGVGDIPKNGHNDRFNYDYPLDEDVMKALRKQMTEHGVIALPSVIGRTIEKQTTSGGTEMLHTRVQFEITLIDTDSGQQRTVHWEGEAQDSQDKGLYKAYTSGMKYWALKTFLMSAGDDVERTDSSPARQEQHRKNGKKEPSEAQIDFAKDLAESSVWSETEKEGLRKRIDNYSRSEMSDLIDDMHSEIEKRKEDSGKDERGSRATKSNENSSSTSEADSGTSNETPRSEGETSSEIPDSQLPADFPKREQLIEEGLTSPAEIQAFREAGHSLTEIEGIGKVSEGYIKNTLQEMSDGDESDGLPF